VFPTSGAAPTSPSAPVPISIPAAADGSYEAMTGVTLDLSSATQYGSSFSITNLKQDGYAPGQLSSLQIADNGIITARYTNGTTKAAGQIELANFRNPQGLQALGGTGGGAGAAIQRGIGVCGRGTGVAGDGGHISSPRRWAPTSLHEAVQPSERRGSGSAGPLVLPPSRGRAKRVGGVSS